MTPYSTPVTIALLLTAVAPSHAAGNSRVAILTGQNNHAWYIVTPTLEKILDASGLFDVDVVVAPREWEDDAAWDDFAVSFADYAVVISDYNGAQRAGDKKDAWPPRVKAAFERYIEAGGKAYLHHAANNAFVGWGEWERMVGLLWRPAGYAPRLYIDDAGETVRVPAGEGPKSGHGPRHSYLVTHRVPEHPVLAGLPTSWMHLTDELYHGQRGPAENMTVLATAYSSPEFKGTGVHEPLVWTIPYGRGLVMTNVMGHCWPKQEDPVALQCAGFQTLFVRSIEWLATDEVTTEKPDDFPGTEEPVDRGAIAIERLPR